METKNLKPEIDNTPTRLGRVPSTPAVQCDPVAELGAPVLALDHQADGADEGARLFADDCKRRTGPFDPGGSVKPDPFSCSAVRIGVWDVEGCVGDLAHPR